MKMTPKDGIRKKIFSEIKKYYLVEHKQKKFVPGKTKVHFAGRVYDEKEMTAMTDAVLDFWLTLGKYGQEFEKKFSAIIGAKHTLLANSGSSANLLAVSSLMSPQMNDPLKPGGEVITPSSTFPTTLNPIIQNNLTPVFVDVELGTYNIDAERLGEALTEKTRLIVLPHTLGNPNEMDAVMDVARDHSLYVIEDACDALGSKYDGRMLGSIGDMGTFSFYPAHHITMGEGGAVTTSDSQLSLILKSLRDWGRACVCPVCTLTEDPDSRCPLRFQFKSENLPEDYDRKYVYTNIGYNLKPTDIQAAMGVEQLKKLSGFTKKRKENFKILYGEFSRFEDYFILPKALPKSDPSWFAFPLTVKENPRFKRKDIVSWLEKNNIETRMLFAGNIVKHPGYRHVKYRVSGDLKNSDTILRNTFFIGVYPGLDRERLNYVIEKTREFMKKNT